MRKVFADTYYWIALLNNKDEGHAAAQTISKALQSVPIVTTQEVLSEVLTHFCEHGHYMRQSATAFIRNILADPTIEVWPQTNGSFFAGLTLYESRPDKEYSLIDCISMEMMRQEAITEVLTHDVHFTQEGFTILF